MKTEITLNALYEHINNALKGSFITNDQVKISARVKLPDENRVVNLKVIGVGIEKQPIPEETRKRMSGMYPPSETAIITIDCETITETPDAIKP